MLDELELLEALLLAHTGCDSEEISEDLLLRFALGWMNEREEERALAKLVGSEALRIRLIEIRSLIEGRAGSPIGQLGDSPFDRKLRAFVEEALAAFQRARSPIGSAAGRTLLRAVGRSANERPLLPATTRFGTRAKFTVGPDGPSGTIDIENGGCAVVLRADNGWTFRNRPLVLVFDDGNAAISVREFIAEGAEVRLELPEFGIVPERLNPQMFRVVGAVEQPRWPDSICAEATGTPARKFRARLTSAPRVAGGKLILEPIIPESIASEYASGKIELRMLIGSSDVLLAAKRVPSHEGAITITADVPGVPDGTLTCWEVFSVRCKTNE